MAAIKTFRTTVMPIARTARSYIAVVGATHGRDQATHQAQTASQNG